MRDIVTLSEDQDLKVSYESLLLDHHLGITSYGLILVDHSEIVILGKSLSMENYGAITFKSILVDSF